MANTYSDITLHAVFAVKNRDAMIGVEWGDDLFKYISASIDGVGQKALTVGGWRDHVHVLFGMKPVSAPAEIIRDIKANSSQWINNRRFVKSKFEWQSGYGIFSCSNNHRDNLIRYIMNQEEHHREKTFKEEYTKFLQGSKIAYDDRYVFEYFD